MFMYMNNVSAKKVSICKSKSEKNCVLFRRMSLKLLASDSFSCKIKFQGRNMWGISYGGHISKSVFLTCYSLKIWIELHRCITYRRNIFSVPGHLCIQSDQEVTNERCSHLVEIKSPCGFWLIYKLVKIPTS